MEGEGDPGINLDARLAVQYVMRANDPIVLFGLDAVITWANAAVSELGWTPDQIVGRSAFDLLGEGDAERALMAVAAIDAGYKPPSTAPFHVLSADGTHVECDVAGWSLGDPGQPEAIAVHLRPTRDSRILRRLLERLLAGDDAATVLADMLGLLYHRSEHTKVLIAFVDEDGAERLVGDPLDPRLGGVGTSPDSLWAQAKASGEPVVVEGRDAMPDSVRDLTSVAGLRDCWIVPVRSGGDHIALLSVWMPDDGPSVRVDSYSVDLLENLTALVVQWRRQTRELERAATRDPLTGLPNRRSLAAFDADGARRDLGVLYIDLDRFKPVNDRLGHAAGDQVLRTVANRLQSAVRPTDIVFRLGGDEFGVVCPGCSQAELEEMARRTFELLTQPIRVHDEQVSIGASIGVARGHDSATPLLEHADRALYGAKESGRGAIRWADGPSA